VPHFSRPLREVGGAIPDAERAGGPLKPGVGLSRDVHTCCALVPRITTEKVVEAEARVGQRPAFHLSPNFCVPNFFGRYLYSGPGAG
jgi:hypothetical protein